MQFLGMIIVFVIGGLAISLTNTVAADAAFVAAIAAHNHWVAQHSVMVGYIASGILLIGTIAIPPLLMRKDANDGGERLEIIGLIGFLTGKFLIIAMGLLLFIPSIGYLAGMGWFAAQSLK